MNQAIFDEMMEFIINNISEDLNMDIISNKVGYSKNSLYRLFRKKFGLTPIQWLWNYRTKLAAKLIEKYPDYSLTRIWSSCGFKHPAHFSRSFQNIYKQSPTAFKKNHLSQPRNTLLPIVEI